VLRILDQFGRMHPLAIATLGVATVGIGVYRLLSTQGTSSAWHWSNGGVIIILGAWILVVAARGFQTRKNHQSRDHRQGQNHNSKKGGGIQAD